MNFTTLHKNIEPYRNALFVDNVFPKKLRSVLRYFLIFLTAASFAASFIDLVNEKYNTLPDGLFFLFLSLFIILFLLECFYNSSRFSFSENIKVEFSVADIVEKIDEYDVTLSFLNSPITSTLLFRLGIIS